MEKLERSVSSSFEEGLHQEEEENWLNVNVSMKASLLEVIEEALEKRPFSSRSRLIRQWIREKAKDEIDASDEVQEGDTDE